MDTNSCGIAEQHGVESAELQNNMALKVRN